MILELDGVSKSFAGLTALDGVSFAVAAGEIKGVIGPNGAGKTTLFNVVTGVFPPTSGTIRFLGRDMAGLPAAGRARLGLSRTFQHAHVFRSLTVLENALLGCDRHARAGLLACGFAAPGARREERALRAAALERLEALGLADERDRVAATLPLAKQRRLELARALATEPRLVLLDEPTAGLNDPETDELAQVLLGLRAGGLSLVVIEHHMRFVMGLSDRIVTLHVGRKIAEGPPAEVREDPAVIEAYLGRDGARD